MKNKKKSSEYITVPKHGGNQMDDNILTKLQQQLLDQLAENRNMLIKLSELSERVAKLERRDRGDDFENSIFIAGMDTSHRNYVEERMKYIQKENGE